MEQTIATPDKEGKVLRPNFASVTAPVLTRSERTEQDLPRILVDHRHVADDAVNKSRLQAATIEYLQSPQ